VAELDNVAVLAMRKFCQKLGKSTSDIFQTWAAVLRLRGTNVWNKGETVWKMMRIPVGQEELEMNSRSIKKLQCWCMPTAPKWQMKSQQQQGLATVLATTFCLMI
jgi:hypothetical protein